MREMFSFQPILMCVFCTEMEHMLPR